MWWLYVSLGILILIAVGLWLGMEYGFRFAFKRGRQSDLKESVHKSVWRGYAPIILAGIDWIESQPWENWFITARDGLKLRARWLPGRRGEGRRTFILVHGYRSQAHNDFSSVASFLHGQGYNILLIDQRAHSESQGDYITFGTLERFDVVDWANEVVRRKGEDQLIVLDGVSMGAATVMMAVGLEELPPQVRCAVADCGFTSPWEIVAQTVRGMHLPLWPVMPIMERMCVKRLGFSLKEADSRKALQKAKVPVLFAHGTGDTMVPWQMTEAAHAACASDKVLILTPNAGHGCCWLADQNKYWFEMQYFLDTNLKADEARTAGEQGGA